MRPVHEAKVDLGTGSQNMGLSGHCRCGAQRCKHCAAVYCAREWNAGKEKADRLISRSAAGRPMVLPGLRDAEHFFRAFLQKLRESAINTPAKLHHALRSASGRCEPALTFSRQNHSTTAQIG